ncbi:sulfurtransferase [Meiothermus granaticius]|jgi:thiosulfate/3-mercaptopyruvate sulfurtransferase|uniref:Sulfurtransferase n=1 Tax=Meiothermus granaticius NBRC 107808 TaxID=1227551 RepID=A0A399FB37_9DEIN|nr:sulfurtransferase [Meiothermus granaticius]RIH93343.1 Thiosulfate sulfurtransferase [Meiothermus granaticius NBRC 107808]GEM85849.1 sulfurtransferase [Meiothermus granaticius NBRC 107808]
MEYAHPEVLVSTDWVLEHHTDPSLRILEVNEDILLYDTGHIPGAQKIDWQGDLWDPVIREFIQPEELARLFERLGISNDTTIVLYGDKNNWWAAYAFWFFSYNGHPNLKLMNGGRIKWTQENKPLTTAVPHYPQGRYTPGKRDPNLRAFKDEVLAHLEKVKAGKGALVDVRSPAEFSGEKTHMPEYPQEGVLRGGHIPGAQSIPWATTVNPDGTFKSADVLKEIYELKGVTPDKEVIAYCRIAERSSHSWFVLKYLLGFPQVKNYDGSWTEWGNSVGVPIEKGGA